VAKRLSKMIKDDREKTRAMGRVAGSALQVLDVLARKPVISIAAAKRRPTACAEHGGRGVAHACRYRAGQGADRTEEMPVVQLRPLSGRPFRRHGTIEMSAADCKHQQQKH